MPSNYPLNMVPTAHHCPLKKLQLYIFLVGTGRHYFSSMDQGVYLSYSTIQESISVVITVADFVRSWKHQLFRGHLACYSV